jgi:hypothetical protein
MISISSGVRRPGLSRIWIGRPHLADVVHRRGFQQQFLLRRRQSKLLGDEAGVVRHAQQVAAGFRVAVFRRARQAQDGFLFAGGDLGGGLCHFGGQPLGAIGELLAALAQGKEILHPGREFDLVHRLGQEVLGAELEGAMADVALGVGRHHDHRHLGPVGDQAQAADELEAVDHRHHVVEQDQVGLVVGAPGERRHRIRHAFHLRAFQLQQEVAEQRQVDGVVVYNEKSWHGAQGLMFSGVSHTRR